MDTDAITSVRNPRIQEIARLRARHGEVRRGDILIDGHRELRRAIESGVAVHEAFWCSSPACGDEEKLVIDLLADRRVSLTKVNETVFGKIAYGDRKDGIVAVGERPHRELSALRLSAHPLIGAVEGVEKPGNLGAVLRTADGAGVEAILAIDPTTDIYGPNVVRSSLGCVFSVPVVEVTAAQAVEWLASRRIAIVAADPAAPRRYTEVDLTVPIGFVFGNEARGLTGIWKRADVIRASVPMLGLADSLNVSITAALFFYEAMRQRQATTRQGRQR
jgi:RNA methyltransferase, TrmH family